MTPPRSYVVVVLVDPAGRVLIHQRAADDPKEPGRWACLGGPLEDDDVVGAALDVLATHVGIRSDVDLTDLGPLDFTWSTGVRATYRVVVGPTRLAARDLVPSAGTRADLVPLAEVHGLDFTESGAHILSMMTADPRFAAAFDRARQACGSR